MACPSAFNALVIGPQKSRSRLERLQPDGFPLLIHFFWVRQIVRLQLALIIEHVLCSIDLRLPL